MDVLNKTISELTHDMRMKFNSAYLPFVDHLANGTKAQFTYAKENILTMYPFYKKDIEELYEIRFERKVQAVNNLTESGDLAMREAIQKIDFVFEQLTVLRASLVQNFFIEGGSDAPNFPTKSIKEMNKIELQNYAHEMEGYSADLTKAALIELIEREEAKNK